MGRKWKLVKWIIAMAVWSLFSMCAFADKTEEISEMKQIECGKPDGNAGYYVTKPMVYVNHLGEEGKTKIHFIKPDGEVIEEILDWEHNRLEIGEDMFQEGKHMLLIWKIDENGVEIPNTRVEQEILVDTKSPENLEIKYEKDMSGEELYFKKDTYVEISVEDAGSGLEGIYYQRDGEEKIHRLEENRKIGIPLGFAGRITVWAEDAAGNKTTEFVSQRLVCENEIPDIRLASDGTLEGWNTRETEIKIGVYENGISSGLAKISCYLDGKLMKQITNINQGTLEQLMNISVKETAKLFIIAEDYAGNKRSIEQIIQVDGESPQIALTGIVDKTITGDSVGIKCVVEDKQRLNLADIKVRFINVKNEESSIPQPIWNKEEKRWETNLELAEDGIYYIEASGNDAAGNTVEQNMRFMIDKTNPVIRLVEELEGKYFKCFNWNYPLQEIIKDFTSYTYEIRLDGKLKNLNISERREGKHVFTVKARDLAGNEAEAKAEFMVDHTNPEIFVQGIENGGIYEDSVTANISTEQKADEIQEICIDGEKQNIYGKKEYQYIFDEIGAHKIEVKAKDLAGNVSNTEVKFEIREKENLLAKVFTNKENRVETEKTVLSPREFEEIEEEETPGKILLVIAGIGVVVAMGVIFYKKKTS